MDHVSHIGIFVEGERTVQFGGKGVEREVLIQIFVIVANNDSVLQFFTQESEEKWKDTSTDGFIRSSSSPSSTPLVLKGFRVAMNKPADARSENELMGVSGGWGGGAGESFCCWVKKIVPLHDLPVTMCTVPLSTVHAVLIQKKNTLQN